MSRRSERENVIFLALSTVGANIQRSIPLTRYFAKKENDKKEPYIFNGYSQLEPGTKYYLNLLAEKKKRADRIVILCSKEAAEDEVLKPLGNGEHTTALELYKDRIRSYILGEQYNDLMLNNTDQDLEEKYARWRDDNGFDIAADANSIAQTPFSGSYLYGNMNLDENFFIVVNSGSANSSNYPDEYFWDAMNAVKGREGNGVNLYMDMQGGDRNALFEMNSVVEMLKDQNVRVRKRIACKYNRFNLFNEVNAVDEKYRQYELLTAEQIFKRYGWGDDLVNYFDNGEDAEDKIVAKAVQKASDAIKMCDVDGFDHALIEIGRILKSRHSRDKKNKLDLILEDIEKDYTPELLSEDSNEPLRYVHQIEWCLKKHFIQQALTILESKMPTEYVRCGLRYYCDDRDAIPVMLRTFEKMYELLETKDRYRMIDINHYYITSYERDIWRFNVMKGRSDYSMPLPKKTARGVEEREVDYNLKLYRQLRNYRNRFNHASSTRSDYSGNSFYKHMKDKNDALPEANRDRNWTDEALNEAKLVREVRDYLKQFRKLYNKADKDQIKAIVDMR